LIAGGYPFYKLCSRKYYTNLLNAAYESDRSLLMENLKMIKYCALTSDAWSSRTADSYTTITIHFIKNAQLKNYVLETKSFSNKYFEL
jgi:hypothetical protein